MNITCWNCKKVTTLDRAAIEKAIAGMEASKLGFHDVVCASCGKSNRTTREAFAAALAVPQLSQRELTKQTKEENARRRGDEKPSKPKPNAEAMIKKAKKKG